jgi:hypothetical protein
VSGIAENALVPSERVWFVADRFERLTELLFEFGYAPDPGPRNPNEWHELHYEDPPTGLVRLKGIRLRDPQAEDSDFDPETTFSIHELWSADHVEDAEEERGFYLAQYSYHGHCHGVDQRWDFDPTGHPDMPHHHHPPRHSRAERQAGSRISPRDALATFERGLAQQG